MKNESRITEGTTKHESDSTAKYKSVRIHPDSFEFLREWAFKNDSTIVSGIAMLIDFYIENMLIEKKAKVDSMYFLNEEHKNNFVKYLKVFPTNADNNNYLAAFYANAAINIFSEDAVAPLSWIGKWNKDKTKFKSSKEFNSIGSEEQKIANLAKSIFESSDEPTVMGELIGIDLDHLAIAQEMIRLNLYGLPK